MILVTGATGHVGRARLQVGVTRPRVVAMVRDVQAASRRLPSGIALRVSIQSCAVSRWVMRPHHTEVY